jgi:hypothetical protein
MWASPYTTVAVRGWWAVATGEKIGQLRPIPTAYKGYRFRSRLEARWAVFLDALGVRWLYEHEGYDLDGLWYLPDFWLPDLECWLEVKPEYPGLEERRKLLTLARTSGLDVFCLDHPDFAPPHWDLPGPQVGAWVRAFVPEDTDSIDYEGDFGFGWGVCRDCLDAHDHGGPRPFAGIVPARHWLQHCEQTGHEGAMQWRHCEDNFYIVSAYTAARQARFEHGESGAPR